MQRSDKRKRRNRLFFLLSLCAVLGIGGVVAATSISINSGTPISLGAGYSTATTCDSDVSVTTGQGYDITANVYKINTIEVSGINLWLATNSSGNGCGLKTLQIAWISTANSSPANTATATSWQLPSSSLGTQIFRWTSGSPNTINGNYYNASAALTSFSISDLSTIAISIS